MTSTVTAWLLKAEGDYRTAKRELSVVDKPTYDVVCYLSQQCIEKTLKAVLIAHQQHVPKTHDLKRLAELVSPLLPQWQPDWDKLADLTDMGIEFRYPGDFADKADAEEALGICEVLRSELLPFI